ncbi:MAG: SulP family inorganic anion transporter [Desulfovibrionaceae bacterium]
MATSALPALRVPNLRGDIFGGLTAGVIALPLALAFGVASGVGAAAGLYGAIALGLLAAVFGGTPSQISGPTGPMTVVTASAVAAFSGDFSLVICVALLAGAFQAAFGVLGLGRLVRFIPYPVISGFMSGIGVIIILLQLPVLLGLPSAGSPPAALAALVHVSDMDPVCLCLAAATMAIVFFTPSHVSSMLPSPMLALVAMTGVAWMYQLDVPVIGAIPAGLPALHLPGFDLALTGRIAGLALALAALGCIDTLLTSIVADSLTHDRHDPRRELIGQGVGNMAAALVGGLPGAGATMRTVVNIKAGGSSRLSGVVHALFLVSVLFGVGPLAAHIPLCVLAGILIKVGVDILDYRMLKLLRRAPREDLLVMLVVFGVTVFADLIVAVGVGVTLAAVMTTFRIARQTQIRIDEPGNGAREREDERDLQDGTDFKVRVITVRGPFFFGTASQMQDKITGFVGAEVVLVNCLEVPFMDISAVFALHGMVEKFRDSGVDVVLAAKPEQREQLLGLGFRELVGAERILTSHEAALDEAWRIQRERDRDDELPASA